MRGFAGLDVQRAAVFGLSIVLIINTAAIAILAALHDGNLSPTLISALADTQHYIVAGLVLVGAPHAIGEAITAVKSSPQPAQDTGPQEGEK